MYSISCIAVTITVLNFLLSFMIWYNKLGNMRNITMYWVNIAKQLKEHFERLEKGCWIWCEWEQYWKIIMFVKLTLVGALTIGANSVEKKKIEEEMQSCKQFVTSHTGNSISSDTSWYPPFEKSFLVVERYSTEGGGGLNSWSTSALKKQKFTTYLVILWSWTTLFTYKMKSH